MKQFAVGLVIPGSAVTSDYAATEADEGSAGGGSRDDDEPHDQARLGHDLVSR